LAVTLRLFPDKPCRFKKNSLRIRSLRLEL